MTTSIFVNTAERLEKPMAALAIVEAVQQAGRDAIVRATGIDDPSLGKVLAAAPLLLDVLKAYPEPLETKQAWRDAVDRWWVRDVCPAIAKAEGRQ